jgi:hypothetical protein
VSIEISLSILINLTFSGTSLGYIVRRYGFNDDIDNGCVYDGGDTSTQLQHFGPLGSDVAMREHKMKVNNHKLLNVRKLFEQRINAFLDKGSGGIFNQKNLTAIDSANETIKPVSSSLELDNKKGQLETNNENQQAEVQNEIVNFIFINNIKIDF